MAYRHTTQLTGKILTIQVLQYLKRGQHLMPSEATYNVVQVLFMGSENIFLHYTTRSWKNKVSMK